MRSRAKTIATEGGKTLSATGPEGRRGMAVELYRDGSGSYVVQGMSSNWFGDMQLVAGYNYGHVCIVMNPEICRGYNGQHGVAIAIVPGGFDGVLDHETKYYRGPPIGSSELWNFGGKTQSKGEDLVIHTALDDAIRLHKALGKVIRSAKRLSKKSEAKKVSA